MVNSKDRQPEFIAAKFEQGLISVVIPTYNRATLIVEAIRSTLDQTYPAVEVIVVDDHSTDDTAQVIQSLIAANSGRKIRYERIQKSGAPTARNRGVELSHGEFIQFLDSDDMLHPDKFEKQIAFLRANNDVQMTYCITELFLSKPGDMKATRWKFAFEPDIAAFIQWPLWDTNGPLWRREALIKMGPWAPELLAWQDWEYHVRALALGICCAGTNQISSYLREHSDHRIDQNRRTPEKLRSFLRATELVAQHLDRLDGDNRPAREALATRMRGIGMLFFEQNARADARKAIQLAIAQRPCRLRRGYMQMLCGLSCLPLGAYLARLVQACCHVLGAVARRLHPLLEDEPKSATIESVGSLRFLPRA